MSANKHTQTNSAIRIIATILSVLLHPVFMPLLGCCLLYTSMPELFVAVKPKILIGWLGMIVINTIMFPLILMLLLKGLGFIKSIYLKDVKERVIPLIGIMVFYFWPYLVAKNVHGPALTQVFLLGNFWGIVLVFMMTIFFKISMHTAAMGSLLGLLCVMMLSTQSFFVMPLVLLLAATILVVWARKSLGAHSNKELSLGCIVGILAQLAAYWYL
jgi:hypothetical protein